MNRVERLERMMVLMDYLEDDFKSLKFKEMESSYKRLGFHINQVHGELSGGDGFMALSASERHLIESFQERYAELMASMVERKRARSIEVKHQKKAQNQIMNGYFNKGILRKSRHINLVSK